MSVSPPFRALAPLLLVLTLSCKGDGKGGNAPPRAPTLDIPEQWQSKEAAIVMRITNGTTTSTEVRRALNELANGSFTDPTDKGIDPLHLLMRAPETDANGQILEPDSTLSTAEKLAGSSVEQAVAFREKVIDGGGVPFAREEAKDTCGNEMIMSVLSPHAIQAAIPQGAQDQEFWPASCPDGLDCQTIDPGSWDIALGEQRYDGMIDMVVNLFPDVKAEPVKPAAFGHLTALFLSDNNPGTLIAPLVANMRRVQINMTGVWELEAAYVDPIGYRELYKFPHKSRELTIADVFVFMEGNPKGDEYWQNKFPNEELLPQGLSTDQPLAIDVTATAGAKIATATGTGDEFSTVMYDALAYQIGAAIACPAVRETAWVRKGPVEFFMCPEVDIDTCVATEDLKEGACQFEFEPEPTILDPFPEGFTRTPIAPGAPVPVLPSKLPTYLQIPVAVGTTEIQVNVAEGSSLFMRDASRVLSARSADGTNTPAVLPIAEGNDHCEDSAVQKLALGDNWAPGIYILTVDIATGTDMEFDDLSGESLLWFYFSSLDAWKQR